MRLRPGLFNPRSRTSAGFSSAVTSVAALAVLGGLVVQPGLGAEQPVAATSDSYDGFDAKAAEQLRLDQCVMADALRKGGNSLYAYAEDSLPLPASQLHEKAGRAYGAPLYQAHAEDDKAAGATQEKARDAWLTWSRATSGLEWFPDAPKGEDEIWEKTGLLPWLWRSYMKPVELFSPFYEPSPQADEKTKKAALAIGDQLYNGKGTPAEQEAWKLWKKNSGPIVPDEIFVPRLSSDDARIFLASGGFPTREPEKDTPEFRVAVEDLKARFASCDWHTPIDPNKVLGKTTATASQEWQEEISAQASQRQKILEASGTASKALQDGTWALGQLLGQSWIADYTTRWQDYWAPGGIGWIGDADTVVEVAAANGKCLDVQSAGKTNGTPVQTYTCNNSPAQKWKLRADGALENVNSGKCLDVAGANSANKTKIQIWTCNSSPAQQWKFNVRATGELRNVATNKCLDLHTFNNGQNSWLYTCNGTKAQQFRVKPLGHNGDTPDKSEFDKAKKSRAAAQAEAKKQLAVLKARLDTAKKAATTSSSAIEAAYEIADKNGAPRGRGLIVGQQKDQVTQGAVAALEAMVKAGETAEAATRASAADSDTIAQRARAQSAQVQAEFRRKAAATAEAQAKASRDAAKLHRDNAKKDAATAKSKLGDALKAEADAKKAAADAHAKRLAAEAEEKTAKAEKDTAAAKQAEANQHKKNAQAEAANAQSAKEKAETAEKNASRHRDDAVKARDHAKEMRDDAWDAEQKADAARAKADAKAAYADSLDADDAAEAARAEANKADTYATNAENAASRARSEANAASAAAVEADAAATRAEAAAKRSRANADAAQAAKLKADAAVRTATSAVADAIKASDHAAAEAKAAVKAADDAEAEAKNAKAQADLSSKEAGKALAAAAKSTGFAYITAQAAADATAAARQVAKPANDAIETGAPYADTDQAADLIVLTGQASKTIAEQQQAVADAHAKNAKAEAEAAKNIADQAVGDSKQAYVHAAHAAGYAATARTYAKEALGYSAEAADYAKQAAKSLARTIEYDRQAAADAAAADKAAGRAEGHAKDARASADQAALDAQAAREAATAAEQAAKDARAAADRADAAATEAEKAAKDALKYAKEAQEAAESAARKQANQQVNSGAGTGVGGTWYVVDEDSIEITDAKQQNDCVIEVGFEGCTVTFTVTFSATVDFFLCTNPDTTAGAGRCPSQDTLLVESKRIPGLKKDVTRYFSKLELIQQTLTYKLLKAVLVQDFVDCWHGSASGCAWAASNFIPGKALGTVFDGIRALDAAMKTGVGVRDAFHALKALDLDPGTLAKLNAIVNAHEDLYTACKVNSFPGTTQVLMADGSHRPISQLAVGDLVKATDPATGQLRARQVTDTFRHDTRRLVDIVVADGGRLESTAGHKFYVVDRGWTLVSDLRVGDRLRTSDGSVRAVTALHDRSGLAPRTVYDLTVDDLHTFFVLAGATPVLVHNCKVALGWQRGGKLDEWAALPENKFQTFSNVSPRDFARIAEMAIADPNVTLHINMTGLADKGTFMDAAQRGLTAGEAGRATDYEMSMIARALANGQRSWSSVKFYSPSGPGGAMRLDPPTHMPDLSVLKGDLDPVKGSVIGYCHC
nr:RICIN domain-containing protein [Streptomyces ferrugineus]